MEKNRILYLDVLRVVACCVVVLMHSPAPNAGVPGYIQAPLYFLTSAGLVLFFMVSGALLLPAKGDTFKWLRHRIGKIIVPVLFWTFFYLIVNYVEGHLDSRQFVHDLFSVPFTYKGEPVMWFMYTLAGLYLLTPILSPWIQQTSRKEMRFFLGLWGFSLMFKFVALFVDIDTSPISIYYYFSGFAGYFILGYYLHNYGCCIKTKLLPLCILIPMFVLLANKFLGGEDTLTNGYLNILVAVMALAWFEGAHRLPKVEKWGGAFLTEFSNCSFGIYLMHIFIMRHVLWNIDFIIHGLGWVGQLLMSWLLTLIISFLLTKAISYLPFSEYIIGYHTKSKKK